MCTGHVTIRSISVTTYDIN